MTVLTRAERPSRPQPARRGRVLGSVVLLLAFYAVLLALGDSRAGSVADVGGKLATAKVLAEGDATSMDVGYWAEDLDPDGVFHPLANTAAFAEDWVQGTSAPYSLLTGALWRIAGPTAVALLSMLAAAAAAAAAGRLARRLGAGDGRLAFWIVGLAAPVAVYALDGWEHAPGLALVLWGVVLGLEAERPAVAAAAGALLSASTLLRADLGAYVLAFGVTCLVVGSVRRRWFRRPVCLAAAALGAFAPLIANGLLERRLLGAGVRDARASAGASGAGHDIGQRITDALLTGTGLFPDEAPLALGAGVALLAALLVLAARVAKVPWATDQLTRVAGVLVLLLYGARLLDGLGFVPGAVAAMPLVVLAAVASRNDDTRVVLGTALGAVPLVWMLQWSGNHVPQWGGRYLLLTTVLLTVVATVTITERGVRAGPMPLLLGLTVVVASFGLLWHVQRTDIVGAAAAVVTATPEDSVVVSLHPQLGREFGAWYGDTRWLSADPTSVDDAVAVAREAAPDHIVLVERPSVEATAVTVPGYDLSSEATVPYLGGSLLTRTWTRG